MVGRKSYYVWSLQLHPESLAVAVTATGHGLPQDQDRVDLSIDLRPSRNVVFLEIWQPPTPIALRKTWMVI